MTASLKRKEPVSSSSVFCDDAAVALDHGGDLLALVRVDQKHDLVVTHCLCSLWLKPPAIAVRQGVPSGPVRASEGRLG